MHDRLKRDELAEKVDDAIYEYFGVSASAEFLNDIVDAVESALPVFVDLLAAVRRGVESGTIKGERRWLCEYPEFGDDNCMVDRNPSAAWQPRKHTQCGWRLVLSDGDEA